MVRRMRAVSDYSSTISGTVNDTVTSVTVASASGLPSEGDFFLAIEEEIVLVTHVSGTTLTIVRGEDGTTAASHSSGAAITGIVTAGYFEKFANEQRGILALPYGRITRWDGSSFSKLTATDFTIYNSYPGSQLSDGNDGIVTYQAGDTGSAYYSAAMRTFSTTSDWRITAHIGMPSFDAGADYFALMARDSSDLSLRYLQCRPYNNVGLAALYRSSFTDLFPSSSFSEGCGGRLDMWFRMEVEWDTSGSQDSLRGYWSRDGVHWFLAATWTPTFASTVDIGIGVVNITGTLYMRSHIYRWHEEALTF